MTASSVITRSLIVVELRSSESENKVGVVGVLRPKLVGRLKSTLMKTVQFGSGRTTAQDDVVLEWP